MRRHLERVSAALQRLNTIKDVLVAPEGKIQIIDGQTEENSQLGTKPTMPLIANMAVPSHVNPVTPSGKAPASDDLTSIFQATVSYSKASKTEQEAMPDAAMDEVCTPRGNPTGAHGSYQVSYRTLNQITCPRHHLPAAVNQVRETDSSANRTELTVNHMKCKARLRFPSNI